jgi:hypothetical protein
MSIITIDSNDINDWTDFWFYEIGVNVIPANTKEKKTFENWLSHQDNPIPVELHEQRKKNGEYKNGIAIIPGQIWRGPFKGKYLVAIDLDNKKAIEEFCGNGLEELKQKTLVEQHADPNKMHIYFIVERAIPNKSSDKTNTELLKKINANDIPAIEVKSNGKGIIFCANSPHQNGSNYRIIGTLKPEVFNAQDVQNRISSICKKYNIQYGDLNNNNNESIKIPITDLFNSETIILEGHNRHEAVLRVAESLIQRNKNILSLEEIKKIAYEWNQQHCIPPLDEKEFERQCKDAVKFVTNSNIKNTDHGDKTRASKDTFNNVDAESSTSTLTTNYDKDRSIADILVELALKNSTLFTDEFGMPYALLKIDAHYEVLPIDGSRFEYYLSKIYFDTYTGKSANAESIKNASRTLAAKAIFEGQTIPLYLRVAWYITENKDAIYYDLTDKNRRCIKITKGNGWRITENQLEVLFKRYGHETAQVEPLKKYDKEILDKFTNSLNIKKAEHKLLVKIWIVSLLIPDIAHPMLLPYGEKGSAKSTLQKKIKAVIDPSNLDLFSIYNDKTQFIQQLSHNYLCFYDNVRNEPGWLSDEACRAVTGSAFSKRKNYSDDDDIPYKYKRILSFSGINIIFTEEDALDRSIKIELDRIREENNIPDTKIEEDLKKQIPGLLGYIFDIVSKALEIKDSVKLSRLPRMADFALWGEAIARAMGYKPLEFLDAYFENTGQQNIEIVEANPFADAISKFMDYEITSWISSPTTFIKYLRDFADNNNIDSSKFPKSPPAISRKLNKIKSNLREGLGIEVIVDRIISGKGNKNKINTAIIKIRKIPPIPPISLINKNDEGNKGESNGDTKINGDNTFNDNLLSPIGKDQNRAQITSDINKDGDDRDIGDNLEDYKGDNPFTTNFFSYDYLDDDLKLRIEEHLKNGNTLKCHHNNCLEVEFSSFQEYNEHCHKKHPKQPLHPEL